MAEHLKPAAHKRHRCRPAKSCEPCRTRKIKCDRGLPCKPCMRSRASLSCTYKSDHRPGSTGSQPPNSPRIDPILDDDVLPCTPEKSQSGEVPSLTEPLCLLSRIEQHIGNSKSSEPQLSNKSELRIRLPHPHLRAEHEKTRLFGKAHWVHSLEQFNVLSQMQSKPYSVVDGAQAVANGAMLEAASARHRAKGREAKLLQEPMPGLRESIPAKGICDQAVDGYLRTFEPMFRILHVPSFMREYESFWTPPELVSNGFLMKLTMVLTIGGVFLADRSLATDIKRTARSWVYAVQWWLIGPTERDAMSIDGIQVFCLLLLARHTNALGGTASILTEALSKLAFTIGLHINPRAHASVTPFESELRRRLWLTVLELLTINALNSTLPLLLQAGDYHVPLPSDTADPHLGGPSDADAQHHAHTRHEELDCSLQLTLAKSLRLRMQIVRELNDGSRESSYEKTVALSTALQAHCRELTAFFQPEGQDTTNTNDTVMRGFHEKFLDTYFRRLILFLHRPFAHRARHDARYLPSRKTCLDASLIMASHTEAINMEDAAALDDFAYCCISGSGMFKGALGQDVILAISLEVITQVEEEEEEQGQGQGQSQSRPRRRDPLALLARSQRRPLMQFLRHVQGQWKHVIRLGRPSLKQYLFVSCLLAQIEATEAGIDAKTAVIETIQRMLRECTTLLRESPAYRSTGDVAWLDDVSPDSIDTMTLFGFDFSALVSPRLP
ncbi:hypothetical protein F4678DRAFT_470980 [Xylaria arbuscula]|nr:hypothetical protein F4678DRAFT_470980 [Xylaria arbuscula]